MEPPSPQSPTMEPSGSGNEHNTATERGHSSSSNPQTGDTKPPSHTHSPSIVTCPVTDADHTSLLDFGIQVCPRCNSQISKEDNDDEEEEAAKAEAPEDETLQDPCTSQSGSDMFKPGGSSVGWEILNQLKHLTKDFSLVVGKLRQESVAIKDKAPDNSNHNDSNRQQSTSTENTDLNKTDVSATTNGSNNMTGLSDVIQNDDDTKDQPSTIKHEVILYDDGPYFLHKQPWHEPFDLTKARGGVEAYGESTALVLTKLMTSIPEDNKRSEEERQRITNEGYFRNPRVDFTGLNETMYIRSKQLTAALRELVTYYPDVDLDGDVVILSYPFSVIFHHLAELEAYKEALSDKGEELGSSPKVVQLSDVQRKITIDHLGQLLEYMNTNMFSRQAEAERARHVQDPPVCTFATMWLLYRPGMTVYVRNDKGTASAYILERVNALDDERLKSLAPPVSYTLTMWCLSFDGFYVRRAKSHVTIGSFEGERPIMDLKVVPASFIDAEDGGKTRQYLIQRGKKWYGMLTGAQQWHYSGQTLDRNKLDSRVVVDFGSYFQENDPGDSDSDTDTDSESPYASPSVMGGFDFDMRDSGPGRAFCPCETCRGKRPHPPKGFPWTDYDFIDPETDNLELPESYPDRDHRHLLCSGVVLGFALKSRTWERLDVELCKPANVNVKAIDTLVMPDDRKRMIKAIVQKHGGPQSLSHTSHWGADFIQTKGEGQLFLLHGGPGVGKTYTAECIAELINRPLLSLTCADLGIDERSMEKRLSKWFKLAEHWGAVLLLDEADVWLERRQIADLKRNTLVAVFLRCLEYYRGILFLTSNRVGTFDDAFVSRIHVVIYYEDLEEPQRRQIWKQFFDKLERERKDSIIVESRAKHFVLNDSEMRKIPWNGREIRNAFQTAVSLAEYRFHFEGGKEESDKIVLDKLDFEQVCQMSLDFKEYLTKVHLGDDEKDRAMRERARA